MGLLKKQGLSSTPKPSKNSVNQRQSALISVNQRLKILVPLCGYTKTFVFLVPFRGNN